MMRVFGLLLTWAAVCQGGPKRWEAMEQNCGKTKRNADYMGFSEEFMMISWDFLAISWNLSVM